MKLLQGLAATCVWLTLWYAVTGCMYCNFIAPFATPESSSEDQAACRVWQALPGAVSVRAAAQWLRADALPWAASGMQAAWDGLAHCASIGAQLPGVRHGLQVWWNFTRAAAHLTGALPGMVASWWQDTAVRHAVAAAPLQVCTGAAPDFHAYLDPSTVQAEWWFWPGECDWMPEHLEQRRGVRTVKVFGDAGAMAPAGPPGHYTVMITVEYDACRHHIRVPVSVVDCQ